MQKILQEIEFLDKKLTEKNKFSTVESSKTSKIKHKSNNNKDRITREARDILTIRCKPWK
eukprot:756246-Hanusia_phi.AAC.3